MNVCDGTPSAVPSLAELSRFALARVLKHAAAFRNEASAPLCLVDATCGNGRDTLFLAQEMERLGVSLRLLSFDVQQNALDAAKERLKAAGLAGKAEFVLRGHQHFDEYTQDASVLAAVFNLGFLPGSDKTTTTLPETTLAALEKLLMRLAKKGLLSVHCYAGHPGGAEETAAVESFFQSLPSDTWNVARYALCNRRKNSETLFLAQPKT